MATTRKKNDWWDTMLYLGFFFLIFIFLYQLLKLWNSSGNLFSGIGQALTNTLATVEAGLSALVTSPFNFVFSLLSALPTFLLNFLGLASAFISGTAGSLIGSSLGSTLGTSAGTTPINVGLGASYSGTLPGTPTNADGPSALQQTISGYASDLGGMALENGFSAGAGDALSGDELSSFF
jgi:hypothetical protein